MSKLIVNSAFAIAVHTHTHTYILVYTDTNTEHDSMANIESSSKQTSMGIYSATI